MDRSHLLAKFLLIAFCSLFIASSHAVSITGSNTRRIISQNDERVRCSETSKIDFTTGEDDYDMIENESNRIINFFKDKQIHSCYTCFVSLSFKYKSKEDKKYIAKFLEKIKEELNDVLEQWDEDESKIDKTVKVTMADYD